jgi:NAD(P)-dependent dehydrogenase (short-subunit alcohol dehydrogenase family)
MELAGRIALVSGAARGIGRVIARVLAEAGASVALADRDARVREAAEELRAQGHRVLPLTFDVSSPADVRDGVIDAAESLGGIDILISNAGIVDHIAPLTRMQHERWDHELAVNLGGAFHLLQAVLPGMVERGWGRIVLISSVAAAGGLHRQAGYAASKAGLIGLAKTVTLEHARDGISCNVVLPGLIETETVASMPAELREATIASTPARRLGRMEEVAKLVAFLASDPAGFINGAEIRIDGGFSLNTGTLGSVKEIRGGAAARRSGGGES